MDDHVTAIMYFFIKIGKDFLLYIPEIRASLSFVIKKFQHLTATKT